MAGRSDTPLCALKETGRTHQPPEVSMGAFHRTGAQVTTVVADGEDLFYYSGPGEGVRSPR